MSDAEPSDAEPNDAELGSAGMTAHWPGGVGGAIEAVLMVSDMPVAPTDLSIALGVAVEDIRAALIDLAADYRGAGGGRPRGFELREVGGGWRLYSSPDYHEVVTRFVREGQSARLTQAALETLAIVAYRQPIARGRISAIRGVNVDSVVRTLLARGLIEEGGADPDSGAVLYVTTAEFLERMGMNSLDELVPLAPYLPEDEALAEIVAQVDR